MESGESPPEPRSSRTVRVIARLASAFGLVLLFSAAAAGGAVLATETATARRLVLEASNAALANLFHGTLQLRSVGRVGFGGARDVELAVYDANGRLVLVARGVQARIRLATLLLGLLRGRGDVRVLLSEVAIRDAEWTLRPGAGGLPTLIGAFEPRTSPSPGEPMSEEGPHGEVVVDIRDLHILRAHVHGEIAFFDALDTKLTGLSGSFHYDPSVVAVDVQDVEARTTGILAAPVEARASCMVRVPPRGDLRVTAALDVMAGGLGATFRGEVHGDSIDASGDAPEITPRGLRDIAPGTALASFASSLTAHAEVHGTFQAPRLALSVGGVPGSLAAHATLALDGRRTIAVDAVARGFDPGRLFAPAPSMSIDARAHLEAAIAADGAISGDVDATTNPTHLGRQAVPGVAAHAHFTRTTVAGSARADEPGAPLDLDFRIHRGPEGAILDFRSHALATDLSRVPRFAALGLHGAADVAGEGRIALESGAIDVRARGQVTGLRAGAHGVRYAIVEARARGRADAPSLDVAVQATGGLIAGHPVERFALGATGPVTAPRVSAFAQSGDAVARGQASVSLDRGVVATDVAIDVARGGVALRARSERVSWIAPRLDVVALDVAGLGAPLAAEIHREPRGLSLRLRTAALDLSRVRRLLGEDARVPAGNAQVDVDLKADERSVTGHVDAQLRALRAGEGAAPSADAIALGLRFSGRRVEGGIDARVETSHARLRLEDVHADGPPSELKSWTRATGAADIDADVDLATLQRLLPLQSLSYSCLSGRLTLRAHAERASPRQEPDATLDASTTGLVVVARPRRTPPPYVDRPRAPEEVEVPWQLQQMDLRLHGALHGAVPETTVEGTVVDGAGPLLTAHLTSRAQITELARGVATAARVPFEFHAEVPRRDLSHLPAFLRPGALRGSVASTLEANGTLEKPHARLSVRGWQLVPLQAQSAIPFSGTVEATYDGKAATVRAEASDPRGRVLEARANADAPLVDLLSRARDSDWHAALQVNLHDFPLHGLPPFATRGIAGLATGSATLDGWHRDARLETNLGIERPKLGTVPFERGRVHLEVDGARARAAVRLEGGGAHGEATIAAETRWGTALAPSFVAESPVDATLDARSFRAGALLPFLKGAVDQLDGRVDAAVRLHVSPDLRTGTFDGDVRLSKGLIEIPALGEQFHDVSARLTVRPWGTLRLDDVTAIAGEGRLKANGWAQLDGTRLRQAQLDVDLPKHLPLTVQGVALGEAQGQVHVTAAMSEDRRRLDADVRIQRFTMTLPESSGHSVQDLGPAPKVAIGLRREDGQFAALPLHAPEEPRSPESTALRVSIDLGDEVRIKRDATIDVLLRGKPTIDVTDRTRLTGTIEIPRGMVELYGKRFQISPGSSLSFTGDPGNPQLVVTAEYDAPESIKLFADLKGDVRKPTIKLRSEPPGLSDDQMLGLLVFGSQEGMAGTPGPGELTDPTQRAAGFAGGFVAQGLNKALSGLGSLEVSTRLDTAEAANPRPEVEVRLSSDVSTRVRVNTGVPAPGESPDRTLVTLDWRFKPRWSLQTTVGDEGSTFVDFLWRHRY
jgi:translocation and assembly module TamB